MNKMPVVIDCDPGTDDIFALMLAKQLENLDVRAITAVAGNVELSHTSDNALRVAAFLGWDVPVAAGASKPLCGALHTAAEIHGSNGMLGLTLPEPDRGLDSRPAWDVIYEEAVRAGKLTLIATGPFTNVAIAAQKYPDLGRYVERIVVMGGAFFAGNTTPATEFNVFVDPEATQAMLESGIPVYICPLDVTHKAYITPDEIARVAELGSEQAKFLADVTSRSMAAVGMYAAGRGVPLHDPCAVMFAADESLFTFDRCSAVCETRGRITRGMTVCDLWSDKKLGLNNAYVVHGVDRERFIGRIMELMARYSA